MSTVMVSGQTSVSLYFEAIRTSTGGARDGVVETAIAFNTTGLSINYARERAAMVSAVVGGGTAPASLASASAAWTAWGFIHVGNGLYRVDFPDAAFAAGVKFMLPTVTGPSDTTFVFVGLVDNTGTDPRSATAPDVNVTTIAGQTASAAGAVAFPSSVAAVGSAMTLTSGERTTVAQAVWDALTSALTTLNSIGKLLVDNINATISSRSTYAGADTAGTTTLLGRLTAGRAGNLDSLDATVSSRLATAGYTAPLDAAGTRGAVGLAAANLDAQIAALPTSAAIVTAVFNRAFGADYQNKTFAQLMQVLVAATTGPTSGAGTGAETFQSPSNGTSVVTVTNDGTNRTGTTIA